MASVVNLIASSGGGGGTIPIFLPEAPYSTPSTEDDEFNTGSLDAKWTSLLTGVDAPTLYWDIKNHIGVLPVQSSSLAGFTQSYTPSGDFSIVTKMQATGSKDTYYRCGGGIFVVDSSNNYKLLMYGKDTAGNYHSIGVYAHNGSLTAGVPSGTGTTTYENQAGQQDRNTLYLRIDYVYSTKTINCLYSRNGVVWMGGTSMQTTIPNHPNRIGFLGYNSGSFRIPTYFDFFRIIQGGVLGNNILVNLA